MPTPAGKPRVGEVWSYQVEVLGKHGPKAQFVVLSRSGGDYWSMTVADPIPPLDLDGRPSGFTSRIVVDGAYALKQGWLKYVGPAGPKTKKELGLA